MPAYEFLLRDPTQNDPRQPAPVVRVFLHLPGREGQYAPQQVYQYAAEYRILTAGLRYSVREIKAGDPPVVCMQRGQAVLQREQVQGAQPDSAPQAQRGRQRVDDRVDERSGFQKLGDAALTSSQDSMFGDNEDGTWQDLVIDANGVTHESPRQ